ncbi:hypothetical protein SISSUDRAFT_1066812 [Sistotremastrum suecicum HHB10207 ss-3]|uniref:Uncharacterized protein n=1 Tax=Sistotremastrum suecicum HHB10207 ss-3 TaxID=1314776 RepID=A0A165XVE3_9AGAM|nr:hypothetical protein SISSUDRAFT_1066812 [Sistotremastrum suecicum HHB10207 ss-3]
MEHTQIPMTPPPSTQPPAVLASPFQFTQTQAEVPHTPRLPSSLLSPQMVTDTQATIVAPTETPVVGLMQSSPTQSLSTEDPVPGVILDDGFYYKDLKIMQAGNTLFQFPVHWLWDKSVGLNPLKGIAPAGSKEGKSAKDPIVLPDPPEEWRAYLAWRSHTSAPSDLITWGHLLRLTTKYDMREPRAEAIKALEDNPELTLVQRLLFCSEFQIEEWFLPSIHRLLAIPQEEWPDDLIQVLGRRVTPIIKMKGALETRNKILLNNHSPIKHVCFRGDKTTCQAMWDYLVQDVTNRMMHPENPITGTEAQSILLQNVAKQPSNQCFTAAAQSLIEKGALAKDQEIMQKGMRVIADEFGLIGMKL